MNQIANTHTSHALKEPWERFASNIWPCCKNDVFALSLGVIKRVHFRSIIRCTCNSDSAIAAWVDHTDLIHLQYSSHWIGERQCFGATQPVKTLLERQEHEYIVDDCEACFDSLRDEANWKSEEVSSELLSEVMSSTCLRCGHTIEYDNIESLYTGQKHYW